MNDQQLCNMNEASRPARIGIYGGTFDPIHLGHLVIAEDALRTAQLDQVFFVPAFSAPLRTSEAETPAGDRMEMVRKAVDGYPNFFVDDFEVRQGRKVYSIETVREYRKRFAGAQLYFLIGWDQYEQLSRWEAIEELRREVTFVCASRGEEVDPKSNADPAAGEWSILFLPYRRIDISATEIRERSARDEPIRSLVPVTVAEYLERRKLYYRG